MSKYIYIIIFISFFCCKYSKKKECVPQTSPIIQTSIKGLKGDLLKEYSLFSSMNPLDNYGQIYLIDFRLSNSDTTVKISKTYKPVIVNEYKDLEIKGGYYDEFDNPIIILDNKNPIGIDFYYSSALQKDILFKYDRIEQPTNAASIIVSKYYLINSKKISEMIPPDGASLRSR